MNQEAEAKKEMDKEDEARLKEKYPAVQRPGPQLLQKRLQKGAKYFDSGDYNMAKAAAMKNNKCRLQPSSLSHEPTLVSPLSTGGTIPTPDCLPTRKASIHAQSKLVNDPISPLSSPSSHEVKKVDVGEEKN